MEMGHQSLHECNYGNSMHHAMGKDGDPQNAARVQLWKANAAYRARSTKINLISEKRVGHHQLPHECNNGISAKNDLRTTEPDELELRGNLQIKLTVT